jgi:uncharacterized protein
MIISELWMYPIKSCGGIRLKRSLVSTYGLAHDRRFMIVDRDTDKMISQREEPRLALVKPGTNGGTLFIHADGMQREEMSLYHFGGGPHRQVEVHDSKFMALDQGDRLAAWFSTFLKREVRLVAVVEKSMRTKNVLGIPMTISCHDSSSLHVITEESLSDLGARIAGDGRAYNLSVERFRPNIVLRGAKEPYEEDGWHNMHMGKNGHSVVLWARKKTPRCKMVNNGCEETLQTLASYRRNHAAREINFGMYFFPFQTGTVGEGDEVTAE